MHRVLPVNIVAGEGGGGGRRSVPVICPAAFTLIELLIVIAVMSMLMALLIPAMGQAKEETRRIICQSNLRQMAIMANLYSQKNEGFYPIAQYSYDADPKVRVRCEWDFITTIDKSTNKVMSVKPGLLWQQVNAMEVQQCPSFRGKSNSLADPFTGYNYNTSYIGHGMSESRVTPAKVDEVRDPTRCALFGDGEYAAGANKFMRSPFPHPGDMFKYRAAGTQGFRHGGCTNVVFCDGHAVSLRRVFRNTTPSEAPKIAPDTGFLSADNSLYDLE